MTVLCGFLGAGKTTLLNHLLRQAEGRRWAAVVNDVAAINIDGAVVAQTLGNQVAATAVIELGNGCVCCSSKDELAETLAELAMTGRPGGPAGAPYEHIWVETTGVAEPRAIANLFIRKNPFGRSLGDFATLSALVSVIDASAFAAEAAQAEIPSPKRLNPKGAEQGRTRPVFELMLEQVECADVLVLNKSDRADEAGLARLEAILSGLNPRAEVIRTEQGQVAGEFLLGRTRFDAAATLGAARWIQVLNTVAPAVAGRGWVKRPETAVAAHEAKYGITSFVYQARRPFAGADFKALFAEGVPGLLRAKGFYWTREQPDEMAFLSVAGGVARHDLLNPWWAAMIELGRVKRENRPASILALWAEPHGDRRQELVFIGVELNEAALRAALDRCLA